MSENLYFFKGLEANLPKEDIKPGALYHCTDTGNTYLGKSETEMTLFSTASGKQNENNSTVIGTGNATGANSTVIGSGTASGEGSTVIGSGTASGDYSVAEGAETIAGCKGYYIAAIDTTNHYIYLHMGEDSVVPSWENPASYHDSAYETGYNLYKGDVNNNGNLDEEDLEIVLGIPAGHEVTEDQLLVADVNNDGDINPVDGTLIS